MGVWYPAPAGLTRALPKRPHAVEHTHHQKECCDRLHRSSEKKMGRSDRLRPPLRQPVVAVSSDTRFGSPSDLDDRPH